MDLTGKAKLAWLAALVDGEGSVYIGKHTGPKGYPRYRPVVVIAANTDYRLMTAIKEQLGCGQIYEHVVSNTAKSFNPRKRRQWTYRLNVGQIKEWLPQIAPYLVLKQEQAGLMMELITLKESRDPRRPGSIRDVQGKAAIETQVDKIYLSVRELNTRGRE